MAVKLLPRFYSTKKLPEKSGLVPISPQMAARPFEAMSQAGEKIEGLGLHAANVFDVLAQKERQAIRQTKALELGESLDNDFNQLTEELSTLSDYEKFVPEMEKKKNTIKEKYLSQLNIDGTPDRDLTFTYEKMFSTKSSQFMNDVRRKKLMIITERGQAALFKDLDKDLANYAMAIDEGTKLRAKNDFEIKVESNVGTLLTGDQAHALVKSFETNALKKEKELIEERKGIVRQKIILDPIQTEIDLIGGRYDSFLKTQDAKADMLEQVNRASKIQLNENEKKIKEQQKIAHDDEDRQVGDLFMKGEYTQAYSLAQQSKFLTGDEKRTWATSIESASKVKEEKIDPGVEAAEIVMINDLISKNVDPRVIRNSIVISPRLSAGNKEQYINKIETKLSAEIADGKRQGYQDIKDIIFPPARGLSVESLIQTPQQTTAIMRAQIALDEWIDRQVKAEKYPSKNEIRNKGFELANSYNPSISNRIQYIEEKGKKQAEEIRKAKEKK